jgi:hypothetical protein
MLYNFVEFFHFVKLILLKLGKKQVIQANPVKIAGRGSRIILKRYIYCKIKY